MSQPYRITSLESLWGDVDELLRAVYVREWGKRLAPAAELGLPPSHKTLLAIGQGQVVGTISILLGESLGAEERARFSLAHFGSALAPSQLALGSRMAIAPALRSGELALDLVREVVGWAARLGVRLLFIASQPYLLGKYRQLGFRPYRAAVSDEAGGLLVPLVLDLADQRGLSAQGSPLAAVVADEPELSAELRRRIEETPTYAERARPASEGWAELEREGGLLRVLAEAGGSGLAKRSWLLRCAPGEWLIAAGQAVRTLYVVLAGELALGQDGQRRVAPGEVAGELSYLLDVRQTQAVRAGEHGAHLLAIPLRAFRGEADAALAQAFLDALARTLGRQRAAQPLDLSTPTPNLKVPHERTG